MMSIPPLKMTGRPDLNRIGHFLLFTDSDACHAEKVSEIRRYERAALTIVKIFYKS